MIVGIKIQAIAHHCVYFIEGLYTPEGQLINYRFIEKKSVKDARMCPFRITKKQRSFKMELKNPSLRKRYKK